MSELATRKTRGSPVRFSSIGEVIDEVDSIIDAHGRGHLRATGGWTAAQICEHLALFIEFSYDGFPFRASWPIRGACFVAKRIAWKQMVDWSLRPGYKLPSRFEALVPDPQADFEAAAARLRRALERIQRGEPMRAPSPFEGRITHEQWVYVHLRHCELHLQFLDHDL
jgi:hypothetical protein